MCYNTQEVRIMEEEKLEQQSPEQPEVFQQKPYEPRPVWQVWLARIGLVAFLIFLAIYYFTMFSKGGA